MHYHIINQIKSLVYQKVEKPKIMDFTEREWYKHIKLVPIIDSMASTFCNGDVYNNDQMIQS